MRLSGATAACENDKVQAPMIEVEGEELVVTLPGTSYAVRYCKLAHQLHSKEYPMEVDRPSPLSQAEFIGKAWTMANEKARDLGWIR